MKQTINEYQFMDAFLQSAERKNQFSYDALQALFAYLEELEEAMEEEIEFDMIAICCEYMEYKDLKELQKDYSDIKTLEELEDHTTVIYIDDYDDVENGTGRFIIQQF